MKIILGYDGSSESDAAIDDLGRAGLPGDASVKVMCVADLVVSAPYADDAVPMPAYLSAAVEAARTQAAQALDAARDNAEQGAQRLAARFPSWNVTSHAVGDSPYWALIKESEHWAANLIVLGSRGRSGVTRLLMGSVAHSVLMHAPCSVRIARATAHPASAPPKILLAVDGSVDSAQAVDAVRLRSWPAGTKVKLVTAVDLRQIATDLRDMAPPVDDKQPLTAPSAKRLEAIAVELRDAGLDVDHQAIEGDPKRVLLQQAEQLQADCIFLGARGHTRLQSFLLGSVSAAITARAHCSVEVVRQG